MVEDVKQEFQVLDGRGRTSCLWGVIMRRRAFLKAVAFLALTGAAFGADDFQALVEKGQLYLDTARVEAAKDLFEKIAAMYPGRVNEIASDRAWVYVRIGNDALQAGSIAVADRSFALAVAIYPDFKDIVRDQWAYTGLYLANESITQAAENPRRADWKAIEKDLQWVLSLRPGEAEAHYSLGVVYQFERKNDKAKREFAAALGGRPVGANRSLNSIKEEAAKLLVGRKYSFDLRPVYPPREKSDPGPWQTYTERPFVVYHHNAPLAKRVAAALRYYLSLPVLGGVISPSDPFPRECDVYVFADEQAFRASGGKETWAGGQSRFTLEDGVITAATVQVFQTTPELTESAVPHELTHVRLAASPYFFGTMPLWLMEGIASSVESPNKKAIHARVIIKAYDDDSLMGAGELMSLRQYPKNEASDVFYAESVAIVESFAEKYGKQRFWEFMSAVKTKAPVDAAAEVYNLTPVDVEDMILQWASARAPSE